MNGLGGGRVRSGGDLGGAASGKRGGRNVQLFGEDFARGGAHAVQIGVPEFEPRLLREPAFADEEAVDNTGLVVFSTRFLSCSHDFPRDDWTVGSGDFRFFQLARHDLFDLVFEPESYFCDFGGRDGGGDAVAA